MKKKYLIVLVALFLVIIMSFFSNSFADHEYDLCCDDYAWCSGGICCNGSGFQTDDCILYCPNDWMFLKCDSNY